MILNILRVLHLPQRLGQGIQNRVGITQDDARAAGLQRAHHRVLRAALAPVADSVQDLQDLRYPRLAHGSQEAAQVPINRFQTIGSVRIVVSRHDCKTGLP